MSDTVVTLGAHVLDILGRYVTHIPEGQGSVLLDEIRLAPAGSAAGTAVGLAKLGLEVATVGAVGDDALGDVLIRALNGFGVDTTHVVRKPGVQTSASILPIQTERRPPRASCDRSQRRLFDRRRTVDVDRDGGAPASRRQRFDARTRARRRRADTCGARGTAARPPAWTS